MLDIITTLQQHFLLTDSKLLNLRYSEEDKSVRRENIVIQAINLHITSMVNEGICDAKEIYDSFPITGMLSSYEEFKDIVNAKCEDIEIQNGKIVITKKWYGELIESYTPKNAAEEIVLAERVRNVSALKDVGDICGLTPEAVRQKELNIQSTIMNRNIGRIHFPELFFYDCDYITLFDEFVFPYNLYLRLCKDSPKFDSVRRYYHYILKRSIKTDSKLPLSNRYVESFVKAKDMLESLDSDFSPAKYKIFEEEDACGNITYRALNPRTILFAVVKEVGEPIHPKDLYFVYKDFIRKNGFGEEYEKPYNYFNWNIVLLKNIIKTDERKVRFYDYEKYEDKFDALFKILEEEFEEAHDSLKKDKFLIRETNVAKYKDILEEIDIHNEVELHSVIRSFYEGKKFSLGRCPVILWEDR